MSSLEHLFSQNFLKIKQKLDVWEEGLDIEKKNNYQVVSGRDQVLANIKETAEDEMSMFLAQSERDFEMIVESQNQELFRFSRKQFFFSSETSVFQKEGGVIGFINQKFHPINWKYDFRDKNGQIFAKGSSSIWNWSLKIKNTQGKLISEIKKEWSNVLQETVTKVDNFTLQFNNVYPSLSVDQKAILLASIIIFDFNRFENKNR